MNKKYRIIVLTDHTTHGEGESIYSLLKTMLKNPLCKSIEVASRSNSNNHNFFYAYNSSLLNCCSVTEDFSYQANGNNFLCNTIQTDIKNYDVVFLRIDRPVTNDFFSFLISLVPEHRIINKPSGIELTGSKEFLLNFPELCPPIKLCKNVDDVLHFYESYPTVLKPLYSYGGKGLIKIQNDRVWEQDQEYNLKDYISVLESAFSAQGAYLAMKYLKNVNEGDKRVIVVNGQIMGATLRIPKVGSWLCNLSMGGSSSFAQPDENETKIAETISSKVINKGVVIFGFDTLVDDDGKRVLSEINTLNVGGLLQAERHSGEPVIQKASNLIWSYISQEININM